MSKKRIRCAIYTRKSTDEGLDQAFNSLDAQHEAWANEHKRAASVILDRQTFYRDPEDTYQGIKDVDMVPNLSPRNMACVEIGKNFMLEHGYIQNDFDVHEWAAPEFLEQASKELIEERWKKVTTEKLPETSELQTISRRIG